MSSLDNETIENFIQKFLKIKNKGWIKSHREHDTGIGKTFEDLMGISENNKENADFGNIEIKTQRKESNSKVTLFTKAPQPRGINKTIRDNYGIVKDSGYKEIHTTFNSLDFNTFQDKFKFKLDIDEELKKINILVKDVKTNEIKNIAFYDFNTLEGILKKKLTNVAYILSENKKEDKEYFKFTELMLYANVSFDNFLKLLKEGKIVYDIRLGTYKTGKNLGKFHDHGSAFRCNRQYLDDLYSIKKNIK